MGSNSTPKPNVITSERSEPRKIDVVITVYIICVGVKLMQELNSYRRLSKLLTRFGHAALGKKRCR